MVIQVFAITLLLNLVLMLHRKPYHTLPPLNFSSQNMFGITLLLNQVQFYIYKKENTPLSPHQLSIIYIKAILLLWNQVLMQQKNHPLPSKPYLWPTPSPPYIRQCILQCPKTKIPQCYVSFLAPEACHETVVLSPSLPEDTL